MATGQLGKTAVISYEAQSRQTGLTDIVVTIKRPDAVDLGPFAMTEYRPGFYRYNFVTLMTDLEGDYLGFISSPTEGHTAHVKLSLFLPNAGNGAANVQAGIQAIGKVLNGILRGKVLTSKLLKGQITNPVLKGRVQARSILQGKILNPILKGSVICQK